MKKIISLIKSLGNNRKLTAVIAVIAFSTLLMTFFSILTYLNNNHILFIIDSSILTLLTIFFLLFIKKNIYLLGHLMLILMSLGLVVIIIMNRGEGGVLLWVYALIFFHMIVFGHKWGSISSGIFLVMVIILFRNWIGESLTEEFFYRYLMSSIVIFIIAFTYEYSIYKTITKLKASKKALETLTKHDSLTGLGNRRYFDEIFSKQIKITSRNNRLLVFVMIDIDFFKKYNDIYGHQAGDKTLQMVSQSFKKMIKRPDDFIFRLGGEEFGMIFQCNHREHVVDTVENVRKNVEALKILHSGNMISPYLTISLGIHIARPHEINSYDAIYKLADDALYKAKQEGRNCIRLSEGIIT